MQTSSFGREQLGVDDLTDQRVPKAVRLRVRVDDEQLRGDRRPQPGLEAVLVESDDPTQQVVVGVVSDRGDDLDDPATGLIEPGKVGSDEIRQDRRDGLTGDVGLDQLGREERIALAPNEHLVDERMGGWTAGQRLDSRRDLVSGESPEVDAVHGR